MEPFLERVLALCQLLLDKEQDDMHRNMDGVCKPHLHIVIKWDPLWLTRKVKLVAVDGPT